MPKFRNIIRVMDIVMPHLEQSYLWNNPDVGPENGIVRDLKKKNIKMDMIGEFIGRIQELAFHINRVMDEAYIKDYNFYKRGVIYYWKKKVTHSLQSKIIHLKLARKITILNQG